MTISRKSDHSIQLEDIPPFLFHVLKSLASGPRPQNPDVHSRLFPSPGSEERLNEDWFAFVQPDLEDIFAAAREIVAEDIRQMGDSEENAQLSIPPNHFDAWLNALNQDRLSVAAENHFSEADLTEDVSPDVSDPRSLLLFRISFFGFLQECLVRSMEEGD